jgi:hypothetical protein
MIEKLKRMLRLIERALDHVTYWLRCHTYNRYHILDMSNKTNDWDWGWKDADSQLLYATMAILVMHIEKEHCYAKEILTGELDYPLDEHLKPVEEQCPHMLSQELDEAEALAIYKWWKYERAANYKLQDEAMDAHMAKYPTKRVVEKVTKEGTLYKWADERSPEQNAEMTAIFDWENDLYQKDTDMIQRLIAIRPRLWT